MRLLRDFDEREAGEETELSTAAVSEMSDKVLLFSYLSKMWLGKTHLQYS